MREPRILNDDEEEEITAPPTSEEVTTEEVPSRATDLGLGGLASKVEWNANTALETGKIVDTGLKFLKWWWEHRNSAGDAGPAPGSTPQPATNGTGKVVEVVRPQFDMERLMVLVEENIGFIVSIKGDEPLKNLPPLVQQNREMIKARAQEILAECITAAQPQATQEAPKEGEQAVLLGENESLP